VSPSRIGANGSGGRPTRAARAPAGTPAGALQRTLPAVRDDPQRPIGRPTGYVWREELKRGPAWYAKYRTPSGRQVKKKLGPAWSGRGRPPAGYFTKRLAEDWLHDTLEEARFATAPGIAWSGATFADAAAEYLRFAEQDRGCKPTTIRNYRNAINVHLLPVFGSLALEEVTVREIERWRAGMSSARQARALSNKTKNNLLVLMHAIFRRAVKLYGLPVNPVANVDRFRVRTSGDIQVFSPEEVWALVRAAASEVDAAIFLTAAFTGLRRGEVLALRWRDVDFAGSTIRVRASYAAGRLTTPKSGKVRAVPMAPDVATALARLGTRERFTGEDDFVFAGAAGLPLDGDALSSRYRKALETGGLRNLRFHDLRHTFGTRMIAKADIRRVQEWMGHADIQTTMKYLHYAPREEDAELVAQAFARAASGAECEGAV
jgi:integrase